LKNPVGNQNPGITNQPLNIDGGNSIDSSQLGHKASQPSLSRTARTEQTKGQAS